MVDSNFDSKQDQDSELSVKSRRQQVDDNQPQGNKEESCEQLACLTTIVLLIYMMLLTLLSSSSLLSCTCIVCIVLSTDTDTMTDKLNRSQPTALEFVEFMIILMRSEDITQLWWVYEGKMG